MSETKNSNGVEYGLMYEVCKLRELARKRPPSEKPGDGEVVLGFLESCSGKKWAEVLEYHPESNGIWLRPSIADDVDGKLVKIKWWIPIKHLLEGNA